MGYTLKRCGAWCGIIVGIALMALACGWVPLLGSLVLSGAKEAAALTEANDATWKNIPGTYDINIANEHFFFHCLNADNVTYMGQKPQFEQYGPYIYREHDVFTDVKYDQDLTLTGTSD